MFRTMPRLQNEAGAGGGAGAGGAGGGAGGGTGGGGGGTALGNEPSWETTVPAKFREGGKADGAIKHDAIYKGYSELEGKLRDRGAPPEKPDAYAFELKKEHMLTEDTLKDLRVKAHGAGLTQKQFELLAGETVGLLDAAAREIVQDLCGSQEDCDKALLKLWPDATKNTESRKAANRAFKAYFGGDEAIRRMVGNNPKFMEGLAKLGAELKEDHAPGGDSSAESSESLDKEIEKEMKEKSYTNPFDPDHEKQKAKVSALFEKRYGTAPATGIGAKAFG